MYVGYRWTDLKGTAPLYPFGYGLSYTAFEYSGVKLSRQEISLSDLDDGELLLKAGKKRFMRVIAE